MRIQVTSCSRISDGRAHALAARLGTAGYRVLGCSIADVYLLSGIPGFNERLARELFCDTVSQEIAVDADRAPDAWDMVAEVGYRPGVADPVASSIRDALGSELGPLPDTAVVQTARQFFLRTDAEPPALVRELHNPLIEHAVVLTRADWAQGRRMPASYPTVVAANAPRPQRFDVAAMGDADLERLSLDRLLALTLPELQAIRDYYADARTAALRAGSIGTASATDVELEMIAQTWSEHCKHKIFAARVEYCEGDGAPQVIDGLFDTYIRATTDAVADPDFVKSVFHDNAGVVRFDDETLLCFKAETHNSPSALDPYGGAITGIVGVNRDILGTGKGARPLFNTNVLCFGYPDTPAGALPEGLLHPRVVMEGVHRGIVDGGNQSGIPVAAGAFLFDESYTGKPLVFCGTGGVLPARIADEDAWIKHIDPGDVAVMAGGLIGKDGIHGATFSSLALDESSPTSAVQIGEPITQKKLADFLLEARDLGLYKGITDNGAGGLSSSFGEMARDSGGVRLDLDRCPLKYQGLAAWEILLSESQERMSFAVAPDTLEQLLELARSRGVEANAIGEFTSSGRVEVTHRGELVASLSLAFLHDGLPRMVIPARWPGSANAPDAATRSAAPHTTAARELAVPHGPAAGGGPDAAELQARLPELLAEPNIASKEHLVRRYDHEVQAGSIVKPHCGRHADAPSDGAVLRPRLNSMRGITVTHGICPRRGDADTYEMAVAAVDEAVRAHVALGGDPDRMAALDNFCWPDPVLSAATPDGPYKMAQLVRACRGLSDACRAYRLPLISGKDSMKNDARLGGRKVSIRPTLLVSLIGIVPDVARAMTTDLKNSGDSIVLIGPVCRGRPGVAVSTRDLEGHLRTYRRVHQAISSGLLEAVHDVSEGGIGVAIAEMAIGGRLGARIDLPSGMTAGDIYAEHLGSFVVECRPQSLSALRDILGDAPFAEIGLVTEDPELIVADDRDRLRWSLPELVDAWKRFGALQGASVEPRTVAAMAVLPAGGPSAHGPRDADWSGAPDANPRALILTGYGTNADLELATAFELAGADAARLHVNELLLRPDRLEQAEILAIPGGFSYGDHVGSGMMLAYRLRAVREALDRFRGRGGLILGICNGFQVLVKLGILPDLAGTWDREVSLVHNESGQFEDSWVTVEFEAGCTSPWTAGLGRMDVPIRHGEGRFVTRDDAVAGEIEERRLVGLRYVGRNPNGSQAGIAGLVDTTGNVLGMMPHPEAYLVAENHPHWRDRTVDPDGGLVLFRNGVRHARIVRAGGSGV